MVRRLLILVAGLAFAAAIPTSAEMYRCIDERGALRFVNRPDACEGSEPYELKDQFSGARGEKSDSESAPVPASPSPIARDLESLLLSAQQAGTGWYVVEESATDVTSDSDFVSWGVREKLARHYTRESHGLTQVCSIEIWRFNSVSQAQVAVENISYPQWQIERENEMLIMIHGFSRAVENLPRRGVFPACMQLGDLQRRVLAESATPDR